MAEEKNLKEEAPAETGSTAERTGAPEAAGTRENAGEGPAAAEAQENTGGAPAAEAQESAPARKKLSRGTRQKIRTAVIAALALSVLGGGGAYARYRKNLSEQEAKKSDVKTAAVRRGDITEKISSTGTIAPKDTYSITALVTGTILTADFAEGDQVTKGQVLYQVDASSMESELTNVENSLTRAKKSLSRAEEDYAEARAKYGNGVYTATQAGYITKIHIVDGQKIGNGTALVELTDETTMSVRIPFLSGEAPLIPVGSPATLTLSDTLEQVQGTVAAVGDQEIVLSGGRLVRYVTVDVQNPGGLTTETPVSCNINGFDCVEEGTFEANYTTTMSADLDASVDCVNVLVHVGDYIGPGAPVFSIASKSVRDILNDFSDKVDAQSSSVDSAQQKVDSTTENIGNYTITAPIDGQVIRKNYKAGDKIGSNSGQSSSTQLATIYDMSAYVFDMPIDETDISDIRVGQTVEVTAEAFPDDRFSGKVTNISLESSVSNGVSTYPVQVTMDSTEKLLPGMNVDAEIVIDSSEDTVLVPADSLMRGNRVYVKDDTVTEAEGSVPAGFRAVKVTTGLVSEDYVEILSGDLSEGDEVYVSESSTTTWNMPMGGMGGMGGMNGNGGGGPGGGSGGGNRGGGGPGGGSGGGR